MKCIVSTESAADHDKIIVEAYGMTDKLECAFRYLYAKYEKLGCHCMMINEFPKQLSISKYPLAVKYILRISSQLHSRFTNLNSQISDIENYLHSVLVDK